MDWLGFILGIAPMTGVIIVCVVAFRRRRHGSPRIINPYTLIVEPNADLLDRPSISSPDVKPGRSEIL